MTINRLLHSNVRINDQCFLDNYRKHTVMRLIKVGIYYLSADFFCALHSSFVDLCWPISKKIIPFRNEPRENNMKIIYS
jgi:hypothetical protein